MPTIAQSKIVAVMTEGGVRQWSAAELADACRLSPPTVAMAVATLVRTGVVARHGYGDEANYRLAEPA